MAMADLKILLTLLSLCVTIDSLPIEDTVSGGRKPVNKYRLPEDTVPVHYNIKINPNLTYLTFNGETSVDFEVRKSTSKVLLHSAHLNIDESETSLVNKDGDIVKPMEHIFAHDTEMLHLRFDEILQPGIYTLRFKFQGNLFEDLFGIFPVRLWDKKNNDVYQVSSVGTHFQPMFARRAFPCWDEPAMKATFNVSVKHFRNYTALSNMPLRSQESDDVDDKVWSHFEITPKLSTNILAFVVVNDYEHIPNADGTMKVWTKRDAIPDAMYFMETAELATEELTRYLNSTTRVPKMDFVALARYSARATENWGLIVYAESALFYNNETYSTHDKIQNVLTTTHEISHQWFGNLVSPAWWKYFWLSEGMATYLKYYITDKMYENWRLMDTFTSMQHIMFLRDDNSYSVPMNQDFKDTWDMENRNRAVIYLKSAVIFRMLSHIVTEDVFRIGLIKYIDKHQYSNVTSDDLWEAMEEALKSSNVPHGDYQVKQVMDTWIEQTGYPLVTVTRDYETGVTSIRQESSPSNRDKRQKEWWIPINYATKSNPNFTSTVPAKWLKPGVENVTIDGVDVDDWIIVNLQQTGYYRVNYDPSNWRKIAEYLNSDNYTKIHVVNRAQLIDDAFDLMMEKQLDPAILIELTNYLSRETDYVVWTAVFQNLIEITQYLSYPQIGEILKPHILRLMDKYLNHIGFEERSDDDDVTKLKRMDALTWACKFGHQKCQEKAAEKLMAYLDDPKANILTPDTERWTLCMGLRKANLSVWNRLYTLEKDIIFRCRNCLEDPEVVEHCLDMRITKAAPPLSELFSQHNKFKSTYDTYLGTLVDTMPPNINIQLDYAINKWENITLPMREGFLEELITSLETQAQLDKIKSFLEDKGIIDRRSDIYYREKILQKIGGKFAEIRDLFPPANAA